MAEKLGNMRQKIKMMGFYTWCQKLEIKSFHYSLKTPSKMRQVSHTWS